MDLLRRFWEGWKRIGQPIADFIGRLILTVFYFTLFAPFGLGLLLWGDPLDIKSKRKAHWIERTTRDLNLKDARRLS
jgi:hypothetical protein